MHLDDVPARTVADERTDDIHAAARVFQRMVTVFPHMYEIHRARESLSSLDMSGKTYDAGASSYTTSMRSKKVSYQGSDIPVEEVNAFQTTGELLPRFFQFLLSPLREPLAIYDAASMPLLKNERKSTLSTKVEMQQQSQYIARRWHLRRRSKALHKF